MKLPVALFSLLFMPAAHSAPAMAVNTVAHVDLPRFMGSWYVIGNIPTAIEKDAYNAIETYQLASNGIIDTTFTYRNGGFDGRPKELHPRGFVRDTTTNARWGMQFIWPIKADYRIVWLADDYSQAIVAREKRDHLWIMARTPGIPDADYQKHVAFAQSLGYDVTRIRRMPQRGGESPLAN